MGFILKIGLSPFIVFYCLFLLCVTLLVTAKLGKRDALTVARDRREAPRKGIEGVLKKAGINETVHELEENLARLRRLRADQRWNSRTLGDSQVRAVKGRGKERCSDAALRIAARMDAERNRLAILKNLGKRHRRQSIASGRRRRSRHARARRRIGATTRWLKRNGRLESLLRIRKALDLGDQIRDGILGVGKALLEVRDDVVRIRMAHDGWVLTYS